MRIYRSAKVKLYPSEEDEKLILETGDVYSRACRRVSDYIFDTKILNKRKVQQAVYYELREEFGLQSQLAISALRQVVENYETVLSTQKKWIKPSYNGGSYRVVRDRSYSFVKGEDGRELLSINTMRGRVKIPFASKGMEKYLDGTWKIGDSNIIRKNGDWFMCLGCSREIDELEDGDVVNVTGVDFGINFAAVSYDSEGHTEFYPGREAKQKRVHYKELRRELSERGTKSAHRRLRKIGQRENRWMNDVNHRISKALVGNSPKGTLFVIEDLTGIRHATEKVRKRDRYVRVSWPFLDLRQKLEYKASEAGDKVLAVNPEYTSQACPKCGHTEKANRDRSTHSFRCRNCGYSSNDDRIGAMNLYLKGVEYLQAVTSEQILDVEGAVNHPAMRETLRVELQAHSL